MRFAHFGAVTAAVAAVCLVAHASAQPPPARIPVRAIAPPTTPFPAEAASAKIRKFSFIAYGDTRGPADARILQPAHSDVVDAILKAVPAETAAGFPVRFVIQSGDAVYNGADGAMWNVGYVPVVERLTRAGVPYFFGVGNHDMGVRPVGDPDRELRLQNVVSANSRLWPQGERRLQGYPAFAFGFGSMFFITFDSNIAGDRTQFDWVSNQLDHLDRRRFPIVVAFFHHPPLSSGPHGGPIVEPQTETIRRLYLPLFRRHHVRMTITGHDHFYDHYVEHYDDATGSHRMDHVVTGGGGAPIYSYRGEPDLARYAATALPQRVTVQHVARPGRTEGDNPHHFLIFEVDGERIWEKWVATVAAPFMPLGQPRVELADAAQR